RSMRKVRQVRPSGECAGVRGLLLRAPPPGMRKAPPVEAGGAFASLLLLPGTFGRGRRPGRRRHHLRRVDHPDRRPGHRPGDGGPSRLALVLVLLRRLGRRRPLLLLLGLRRERRRWLLLLLRLDDRRLALVLLLLLDDHRRLALVLVLLLLLRLDDHRRLHLG